MERSRSGLFAMQIAELTPKVSVGEPVGAYDPVEQLWRDEGTVVAASCSPTLIVACVGLTDPTICRKCLKKVCPRLVFLCA